MSLSHLALTEATVGRHEYHFDGTPSDRYLCIKSKHVDDGRFATTAYFDKAQVKQLIATLKAIEKDLK